MKKRSLAANARKISHESLRKVFSWFPRRVRFAIFRSFVECDPAPDQRLVLKIAETRQELEACFKLLHDAYVSSGFMKPAASGLRATIYHALPTTTTLCAKFDGEVVGTLSLIRESVFGFPLQAIFDLKEIRARGGKIAEVSALAVHPDFRKTGGVILFPLMKFMYEYCTTFFDTRHLVIAVHPTRIEMYESLLLFNRLNENEVANYVFANAELRPSRRQVFTSSTTRPRVVAREQPLAGASCWGSGDHLSACRRRALLGSFFQLNLAAKLAGE